MKKLNNAINIIIGRTKRFLLDTENRKLTLYGIILFIILIIVPAIGESYQHQYEQLCIIYEIHDDGIVDFIDPTGEIFCIDTIEYGVCTKWLGDNYKIGDAYMIKFFDNFTDYDRTDDIILKIKRVD